MVSHAGEGGALGSFNGQIHAPCSSALVRTRLSCAVRAEGVQSYSRLSRLELNGLILPRIESTLVSVQTLHEMHGSM